MEFQQQVKQVIMIADSVVVIWGFEWGKVDIDSEEEQRSFLWC